MNATHRLRVGCCDDNNRCLTGRFYAGSNARRELTLALLDKLRGPPGPRGGFWSAQRIRARHHVENLFWVPGADPAAEPEKYDLQDECLRASSYNIKMGGEAYVTPVSESDPKS